MIDIDLMDEWGGIDKKIKSSVLGLNKHGIVTTGSCEGDKAPCPWIMVKSPNKKIKYKFNNLLREFYKKRKVAKDVRIKTFAVGSRFYIYSGKRETFASWRRYVNKTANIITQDKKQGPIKKWVSTTGYQKEFIQFGEFLLSKQLLTS